MPMLRNQLSVFHAMKAKSKDVLCAMSTTLLHIFDELESKVREKPASRGCAGSEAWAGAMFLLGALLAALLAWRRGLFG